jgi:hypothetical protein
VVEGVNSSMTYLTHCKNFCKFYIVPTSSTTITTTKKKNLWQKGREGRETNECYSKTKENQSWGMLPGDPKRVTSLQKLKQTMK